MTMSSSQQSAAVAEAHYQWVMRHRTAMPFDPAQQTDRVDDDYNQHHLTVSGSPDQQADLIQSINAVLGQSN